MMDKAMTYPFLNQKTVDLICVEKISHEIKQFITSSEKMKRFRNGFFKSAE